MKNKTILDIARELKLSPSTVSRALNNHPDINTNTKKLVNQVAQSMGYVPNPIALGLKKNRTSTIGVIVPEIKHDFFASAISGIEEVAYRSGFTIILCQSNESYEREVLNTLLLIHHRVAGIIVSISQTTQNGEHFNELNNHRIPLVFFDRVCKDVKASKVTIDDKKSAYNAVHYLVQKGYNKIAHLGGPVELDICEKRYQGYREALEEGNLNFNPDLVLSGGLHEQDGYSMMDDLLNKKNSIDAIFAVNDPVAIGAFQRIKEAGLKIPKDIGIVGFSNNKIAGLLEPQLTTVNQPSFNMGKRAAEIMVELINKGNIDIEPIIEILDAELILRGSA
jgi:DNA-binding LacI/PurR family transcriptional regulator